MSKLDWKSRILSPLGVCKICNGAALPLRLCLSFLEGLIFCFLVWGLFQVKAQLVSSFNDGLRYLFLDC
jgi:hypothetical protein